jgi:hypothetical protein
MVIPLVFAVPTDIVPVVPVAVPTSILIFPESLVVPVALPVCMETLSESVLALLVLPL